MQSEAEKPRPKLRSVRTGEYKKMLARLPAHIQEMSVELFKLFELNPHHPQLENEDCYDSNKGRHRTGSRATSITRRYRALYVIDNGRDGNQEPQYCWYWVGSHESYNNFIGARK